MVNLNLIINKVFKFKLFNYTLKEMIPEKHQTSELLKMKINGLSLEDPEPEPLIKREKGKWNGIQKYEFLMENDKKHKPNKPVISATINTAKTTLAHQKSAQLSIIYQEVGSLNLSF